MIQNKTQELPKDIGGYQHVEFGFPVLGDIIVQDGRPIDFLHENDINTATVKEWEAIMGGGQHIYRKLAVPSARDDKALWGEKVNQASDSESKPSNPKDMVGSDKLPLHLWPATATALGCLGLLDGMLKYGRGNWREIGVKASIYYDAFGRHTKAWFEGEDTDPDSGLPHLAHALACLAILIDAQASGKMNDDRAYPGGYRKFVDELTPHVARLKAKHKDKSPKHFTINDINNK